MCLFDILFSTDESESQNQSTASFWDEPENEEDFCPDCDEYVEDCDCDDCDDCDDF